MVFVTAIGFFIVPALLGGRRETMITQIIIDQVLQTLNWGFAGAISVLLLLVVLAVFAIYDRLLGLSTMTGVSRTSRRKQPRQRRCAQTRRSALLTSLGALFDTLFALTPKAAQRRNPGAPSGGSRRSSGRLLFLISLPAFLMIPLSFGTVGSTGRRSSFTLHWYREVFASPLWTQAVRAPVRGARRRAAVDADRHPGSLPARAQHHARQGRDARLRALADRRSAHDHRGRDVLLLRAHRPRRQRVRPHPRRTRSSRCRTW